MKLNLTKEQVNNISEITTFVLDLRDDWLTLHAEVEAQTKLIEQLEKALETCEFGWNDYRDGKYYCPECEHSTHTLNCGVGLALSAVDKWRKERG